MFHVQYKEESEKKRTIIKKKNSKQSQQLPIVNCHVLTSWFRLRHDLKYYLLIYLISRSHLITQELSDSVYDSADYVGRFLKR